MPTDTRTNKRTKPTTRKDGNDWNERVETNYNTETKSTEKK